MTRARDAFGRAETPFARVDRTGGKPRTFVVDADGRVTSNADDWRASKRSWSREGSAPRRANAGTRGRLRRRGVVLVVLDGDGRRVDDRWCVGAGRVRAGELERVFGESDGAVGVGARRARAREGETGARRSSSPPRMGRTW